MITVIQRVSQGKVLVANKLFSEIGKGYVILVGIYEEDNENDAIKLAEKIANLRVMADENGKMNLSIIDAKGEVLLISQFTLCGDTSQRRPSFIKAKKPDEAEKLYQLLIRYLMDKNIPVKTGKFGEYMKVEIHNDGPVTIILNTS